jgi:predicted nucleotidyltransferase
MRISKLLDALFPEVRIRILAATLLRPERSWFLTELAAFLGTRPSSLQREIESLSEAGILRQWRDGRRLYVKAEQDSPVFQDLVNLLEKTVGIIPTLQDELSHLSGRIRLAFVYGSVASSQEQTGSDIDLVIVGTIGLADLTSTLRTAEKRLGRPVNPTVYSTEEFRKKVRKHDHFLTSVLAGHKLFIEGGEDELAILA